MVHVVVPLCIFGIAAGKLKLRGAGKKLICSDFWLLTMPHSEMRWAATAASFALHRQLYKEDIMRNFLNVLWNKQVNLTFSLRKMTLVLLLAASACTLGDSSPWIWKIEGRKLTVTQLEEAYNGYFFLMAQQFQSTPEQLKQYLKDPSRAGEPRLVNMLRQLQVELQKENFAERYKQLVLLNYEAKKNKMTKSKQMRARLEFLQQYFVANIYMSTALNADDIKISDEQAVTEWEAIRKREPRAKHIPIDQGIEIAKNQLKLKTFQLKQQSFMKNISESYKIETNPDFDLKGYLNADSKVETKKQEAPGSDKDSGKKKTK